MSAPPALVLAAGSARRFGSDKRLHLINGVPMLRRTLDVYRQVFDRVAVVIRPNEPTVEELVIAADCTVVQAADAHLGQSASLAAGVAAIASPSGPSKPSRARQPQAASDHAASSVDAHGRSALAASPAPVDTGLVIGLGDMPYIQPSTLTLLICEMAAHPDHIVRPSHAGRHGNPVAFPARVLPALMQLSGDRGARGVIAASQHVRVLDVYDAGVIKDVDRPRSP